MKTALIIAGGAIALLLAKGGQLLYSGSRIQFFISKLGFEFHGLTPYVIIDVMAQNPTGQTFDFSSMVATVYANGSAIGNIAHYQAVSISASQSTKIILPVKVSLTGAATTLANILQGKESARASVRVAGTVNVNAIPAPIDLTYSIV